MNDTNPIVSIDELFRPTREVFPGAGAVPAWSSMEALLDHFLPVAGPEGERSPVPDTIAVV